MERLEAYNALVEIESISNKVKIIIEQQLPTPAIVVDELNLLGGKAQRLEAYIIITKDPYLIQKVEGIRRALFHRLLTRDSLGPKTRMNIAEFNRSIYNIVNMGKSEGEPTQGPKSRPSIPQELQTEGAKKLFNEAIKAKFIEIDCNAYRWKGQSNELAAFVDCSSTYLNIRPSNKRVPWRLYKQAFNLSEQEIRAARDAKKDYDMERRAKPDRWDIISGICS